MNDNQSGNSKSTDSAPITNEPELTANHGTENKNPAAQPQSTGLDKRITGLSAHDKVDSSGAFTGEGVQEKTPISPVETRNAAKADGKRIEEQDVQQLHEDFPATDIGPKHVPPYAPVAGLDEAYEQAKKDNLDAHNQQAMGNKDQNEGK